jgi:hypothetical protein
MEQQAGPGRTSPEGQSQDGVGGDALAWLRSFAEPDEDGTGARGDTENEDAAAAEDSTRAEGHIGVRADIPAEPVPETGEPRVDAALRLLGRLPGLPVSDHPELFEQVHAQLSEVLGELDTGPAGPAGSSGS